MKKQKHTINIELYEAMFVASLLLTITLATLSSMNRTHSAEVMDAKSGSGAVVDQSGALVVPHLLTEDERNERIFGFILRRRSKQKEFFAYKNEDSERWIKRKQHGDSCLMELRMANRDTKLPILFRCYRAQLTLNLESLRKEKAFVLNMPGISEDKLNQATSSIDNLTEAITTMIDGIDSVVYTTKESLEESKVLLAENYRTPYWKAQEELRADYLLTWAAYFMDKIEKIENTDLSPEDEELVTNARECIEDVMLKIQLEDAQGRFKECVEIMRN
ncbi:hypothetical protein KJ652_03065 [Patescibacteria group bacterium]|nr:hypothetical protein [Patescibacteria group bacterium]MBU1123548.1 hypothetical protein [Patescibacteria group bacterium]MBU1911599.1 hypothetical protein [Patescibacteria group bacterium]